MKTGVEEIQVKYQRVNRGRRGHHVTVEYHDFIVRNYLTYGVNVDRWASQCNGIVDFEDSTGATTLFCVTFSARKDAEKFIDRLNMVKRHLQNAIRRVNEPAAV